MVRLFWLSDAAWAAIGRTLAWFAQFRRLAVRYERRADIHMAFTTPAASLIIWRFVQRWSCSAL